MSDNQKTLPDIAVDIKLMKKHLKSLRKIAGWTAEELGEKIGLSTQTINGLENKDETNLSMTQYIVLRVIFAAEAADMDYYKNNESLKIILAVIFDNPELYNKYPKIADAIPTIAAAIAGNTGRLGGGDIAKFMLSGCTNGDFDGEGLLFTTTLKFLDEQILPRGKKKKVSKAQPSVDEEGQ